MRNIQNLLLFSGLLLISFYGNTQRLWDGSHNLLGLQVGVNHFKIAATKLPFSPGKSWTVGFTTRSNYRDNFQFIYGLNVFDFQNHFTGRPKAEVSKSLQKVKMSMIGVQANLFGSYKIINNHLSVEGGPVVQVNGPLIPQTNKKLYYVGDFDFQAQDLKKIAPFNVNLAIGVSGGFEKLKLWAQYQYGLNNFLGPLSKDLQSIDPRAADLKGHLHILAAGVVVLL